MSGYKNNYYYFQPNSEELHTNKFMFDVPTNKYNITGMDFILEIKGLDEEKYIKAKGIYLVINEQSLDFTERIKLKYVIKNKNYDTYIFHVGGTIWSYYNECVNLDKQYNFSFQVKLEKNNFDISNAYLKIYYNEPPNDPVSKLFQEKPLLGLFYC